MSLRVGKSPGSAKSHCEKSLFPAKGFHKKVPASPCFPPAPTCDKYCLVPDKHRLLMNAFIREAPIEENTSSECIVTVAAMYGCEILRLCEYDANVYGYQANCQ